MNTDRTANANLAPRCQHTKMNGQPCAAPARRSRKYCVFHEAAHAKRPDYAVRLVEDAMSLQFALFQVMRALDDHALDPKRAALKLYALQIASSNLKRLQQEIDYNPSEDPARQQSLLELLFAQFPLPADEVERERAWEELDSPQPQPCNQADHDSAAGNQPPAVNFPFERFDIKACADSERTDLPADRPIRDVPAPIRSFATAYRGSTLGARSWTLNSRSSWAPEIPRWRFPGPPTTAGCATTT